MGQVLQPTPVKLIVPMLAREAAWFERAERRLAAHFGPTDYVSALLPFEHTRYYEPEFGPDLLRLFIAFARLIDPGSLAEIKLLTNALEAEWSVESRRQINLDPGYLSGAKLVLATTKNQAHRIYLGQGIYAEVTLMYRDRDYRALPWTYPDYASEAYLRVLREVRALYMQQLRTATR
ncbi:MAG: DUF4416 family protein [Anaerolineae bacterium]|nr:DUF4416 family protein [Anaerolineae bacterium]